MFDTRAEAQQKIQQTVVMLGDEPVWVVDIGGRDGAVTAHVRTFVDRNIRTVKLSDPSWDVKSLGSRLGYINLAHLGIETSVFSRRSHIRRAHQTQGLSNTNVLIDSLVPNPDLGWTRVHTFRFSSVQEDRMRETLQQRYPSLPKVRYLMKSDSCNQAAFDPCLSVSKDKKGLWKLNYKGQEIGWTDDLEIFRVPEEWRYLDQRFSDCGMKVRECK